MKRARKKLAVGYIEDIWNNNRLEMLPTYLHPDFRDHSLPDGLKHAAGLLVFLKELRKNISHRTTIEKIIHEDDFVVVKVKIILTTLPNPVNQLDSHKQDEIITGYRILAMSDQRIIGHWEFFDPI